MTVNNFGTSILVALLHTLLIALSILSCHNNWDLKFTHLEHPDLADHGLSVYLTHVVARVIPLHVPDVQLPGVDPVV